ncbi:MAG TPA: hypothetical protein PKC54_10935 [Ferruginibacter sp.]|nr:hypothetical protein [Ferruginibacter sp.]
MFETYENVAGSSMLVLVMLGLLLLPTIFYFLSLQRALEAVSEQNRQMPPGQVWLSLIPLFNFVWMFFVVNKIAESFALECYRLNIPTTEMKPTQGIGNAKNILRLCSFIPILGLLASLGFVVCWILHWIKVNEYRKLIIANRDNFTLDAEKGVFHQ